MKAIKGYLCTIIAGIGFGLQPLLATFAYSYGVSSKMLALLRVLCMVPVFVVLVIAKKDETFRIKGKHIGTIIFLALTGAVLTTLMLFQAYTCIDTGTATTLNFNYPVFVLAFGVVFFHEKISKRVLLSFFLCVGGILFFCNPSGDFTWQGFFLALGSGLTYGIYVLYMDKSRIIDKVGFYTYTFYFFLFSTIMLFPIVQLSEGVTFGYSWLGWFLVINFAIDGGILATVLLQIGVREIGGSKASILSAVEPVTSALMGILVLKESVKVASLIGIGLVIASTVVMILGRQQCEE